ncbi:MAG TPA: hypothetical protein VI199_12415, partial [Novosphingobium sp.]
ARRAPTGLGALLAAPIFAGGEVSMSAILIPSDVVKSTPRSGVTKACARRKSSNGRAGLLHLYDRTRSGGVQPSRTGQPTTKMDQVCDARLSSPCVEAAGGPRPFQHNRNSV